MGLLGKKRWFVIHWLSAFGAFCYLSVQIFYKRMNRLCCLLLLGMTIGVRAWAGTDSLLENLTATINRATQYDARKLQRIEDLKAPLRNGTL
jgi:hypothetical protein